MGGRLGIPVGRIDTVCNILEVALVFVLLVLLVRTLMERRGTA